MFKESKYNKVLTVFLVIVIIAILGLIGFLVYDFIQKNIINNDSAQFVEEFEGDRSIKEEENTVEENNVANNENQTEQTETTTSTITTSNGNKTRKYKGFDVAGTIRIPKINLRYPILEKVSKKSIEVAVAVLYSSGEGLNKPGNTVIIGHNYRNGLFFSNVKKLQNGDKIYITDNSGTKLTYTIYNKFETTPEDTSFYTRDTNGKAEITLSTCTDDSSARIIILAKAE